MLRSAGTIRNEGFPAKYAKKSNVQKPVLCILALLQRNVAAKYLYKRKKDVNG